MRVVIEEDGGAVREGLTRKIAAIIVAEPDSVAAAVGKRQEAVEDRLVTEGDPIAGGIGKLRQAAAGVVRCTPRASQRVDYFDQVIGAIVLILFNATDGVGDLQRLLPVVDHDCSGTAVGGGNLRLAGRRVAVDGLAHAAVPLFGLKAALGIVTQREVGAVRERDYLQAMVDESAAVLQVGVRSGVAVG